MATIDEKSKRSKPSSSRKKPRSKNGSYETGSGNESPTRPGHPQENFARGFFDGEDGNPEYAAKVMSGFDSFLKRDDERVLFGLAPMPKPAPDGQSAIQPSPSSRAS